jgi:hypothetical protein
VCCGTKRLVEIRCPADCGYLAAAREHPPAAVVRRQQHDLEAIVRFVRDFNEAQSRLFFLILSFLARYEAPELQPLVDEDVAAAMAALGATFETASRGVIYEHRADSPAAQRLAAGLKPLLSEAGSRGGSMFERDAAVVLRRVAAAVREVSAGNSQSRRPFVELVTRVIKTKGEKSAEDAGSEAPRLIIP